MIAAERLTAALVELASHGGRPPCGDWQERDYWLSDDPSEREQAAAWCAGCPVIRECGEAADENGERFGVWGFPRPDTQA